jgi:regulator of nucleoside diphosphate kinase
MKQRQIYITAFDKKRLDELVAVARDFSKSKRGDLEDLRAELARAKIVEPKKVPADVVTMNSEVVLIDVETGEEDTYRLVFPDEADIASGAISVLAPIGTAILGYREGVVVDWLVPAGSRQIRIEKILYQPEAAGHFDR